MNPLKASTLTWTGDTSSAGGGLVWNRPTLNSNPPTSLALAEAEKAISRKSSSSIQPGPIHFLSRRMGWALETGIA